MKRVAIIQSCYIPWKGFFDLISRADIFVIYDTVNYSKNHWHNRNRIKRAAGQNWLTIPVMTAGRVNQAITDVEVAAGWAELHWKLISDAYRGTRFFKDEAPAVRAWYEQAASERRLSTINEIFIRGLAGRLGLSLDIVRHEHAATGDPTARLVSLCASLGCDQYISGPSARDYLNVGLFDEANIGIEWMTYGPYGEYDQPHGAFEHNVSVLDVLFCTGQRAREFCCPLRKEGIG